MQITVNTRRERGIFDEGTSCNNNYRGWGRVRVARDECLRRLMARKEFDVVDTVFCLFFLTSKTLSILLFNFYKNLKDDRLKRDLAIFEIETRVFGKYIIWIVARIEHPFRNFSRFGYTKVDSRVTIFENGVHSW